MTYSQPKKQKKKQKRKGKVAMDIDSLKNFCPIYNSLEKSEDVEMGDNLEASKAEDNPVRPKNDLQPRKKKRRGRRKAKKMANNNQTCNDPKAVKSEKDSVMQNVELQVPPPVTDSSAPSLELEPPSVDTIAENLAHDLSFSKRKRKRKKKNRKGIVNNQNGLLHGDETKNASISRQSDDSQGCGNDAVSGRDDPLKITCHVPERAVIRSRRKLLILDINGLLVDVVSPPPKDYQADFKVSGKSVFRRPFYRDFLKFCFERFDVGIWSSRAKKNIDKIVNLLLDDLKDKLLFCWDESHATRTGFKTLENKHKPLVCKELRKIWEKHDPCLPWDKRDYDATNTLLVDDSPYKALLNPLHTAIFPQPFRYTDMGDNSLGQGGNIREYLEELSTAEDVQKFVEHHPFGQGAIGESDSSWSFYESVISETIKTVSLVA